MHRLSRMTASTRVLQICLLCAALLSALPALATARTGQQRAQPLATGTALAQDQVQVLLARIYKQGDKVPPRIFEQLGRIRTGDALEALRKSVNAVHTPQRVNALFNAVRHFAHKKVLESDALEFLAENAKDKDEVKRRAAMRALTHFGAASLELLEKYARTSRDEEVKRIAIGALAPHFAAEPTSKRLELLISIYHFPETGSRSQLIQTLRAFQDQASLAIFAQRLKKSRFPRDMKLAIVESVSNVFESGQTKENEGVITFLSNGLKSKDPLVQIACLQVLEVAGTRMHLKQLEDLENTRDPSLRRAVFTALTRHLGGEERWLKKMLDYARSPDMNRRVAAVQPLVSMGGSRALEALLPLIEDKEHSVRRLVFQGLTRLRENASVGPLVARMEREDARLLGSLRRTLSRLTGEGHGLSPERWKAWWRAVPQPYSLPSLAEVLEQERLRSQRRGSQVTVASFYGIEIESDRAAWVLDVSGSMAERTRNGETRVAEMKLQVVAALAGLQDGDLFNIVLFSGTVQSWKEELTPMTSRARKEAGSFLRSVRAAGATAIFDALEVAIADPRLDTVYLLSDGENTSGAVTDTRQIRATVREWAKRRPLTINCIAIGDDHPFLRDLAKDTGGQYRRVD